MEMITWTWPGDAYPVNVYLLGRARRTPGTGPGTGLLGEGGGLQISEGLLKLAPRHQGGRSCGNWSLSPGSWIPESSSEPDPAPLSRAR